MGNTKSQDNIYQSHLSRLKTVNVIIKVLEEELFSDEFNYDRLYTRMSLQINKTALDVLALRPSKRYLSNVLQVLVSDRKCILNDILTHRENSK